MHSLSPKANSLEIALFFVDLATRISAANREQYAFPVSVRYHHSPTIFLNPEPFPCLICV